MKLGYFTMTHNPPELGKDRQDPKLLLEDTLAQCLYAEELGFNSAWVPEHHFGLLGVLPSPATFLSYVAAKTQRIKLAPATVVLPLNHPLRLAEEFALLDLLSDGRAIFSAGRGYDAREYAGLGADFQRNQEIFFEGLDIVKRAWTQETFSYQGDFYQFQECTVIPRPVQQPHPPIYVAGFSEPTLRFAAQGGFNAIFAAFGAARSFGTVQNAAVDFKRQAEASGHPNSEVMTSYFVNVTSSKDETLATKKRLLRYFEASAAALPSSREAAPDSYRYLVDEREEKKVTTPEDLDSRSIITGSPEDCLRLLKDCEESGISEVILYFGFGALGHKETMESMERVAKHLLPYFDTNP